MGTYVKRVLDGLQKTCGHEKEFLQSTTEVLTSLSKLLDAEPKYEKNKILIQKMQEKGYVTDEKQCFTVKATPKPVVKRRWFERKERKHENK